MSETDSLILHNFKTSILKEQVIPCIRKDISDIINDRRRWSKIQTIYEYLRDIIIVASFISVFFDYKVITGLLISLTGYFIKLTSHAENKEKELTKRLDEYLSQLGITQLIPNISLSETENESNESNNINPTKKEAENV